ncbi:N-acetyltransferase ECO1 [Lentinula edodes]|uniref:N-acetyltransferase ECO1 n=1 Tax=Lentinula edodes TaxID=5353 RepID=A0A1Q3EGJ7_LENED|nr:N-acetyltransferase ECO1 [Lentinula edodes]
MEWGKEEERDKAGAGNVKEIVEVVKLKDGKKGRIICVDATVGGKIGSKLSTLLETINVTLSASTLSPEALRASKAYLFLLPAITPNKEKIVGCIFAQRIEKAMAVAPSSSSIPENDNATPSSRSLLTVDDTSGLFCYPELLPTALGISRIFVTSTQRRQGIASSLLSAAAQTAIHGCVLDPKDGQIAFSQTTGDGIALMRNWGQGGIRIYDEDNC